MAGYNTGFVAVRVNDLRQPRNAITEVLLRSR